MSESSDKVIVAGCKHGGLAVIRALGQQGLEVIALTNDPREFATVSRYVSEIAICPDPNNAQEFIGFLLQQAKRWSGALIIETDDYYSTALSTHKTTLSEHYRIAVPDWDIAQLFIEKDRTFRVANECGVPQPGLYQPQSLQELDEIAAKLVFPIMMKPVRSHEFVAHFNKKLFIVDDMVTLREKYKQTLAAQQPVMLQEIIPGTDEGTLESIEIFIHSSGEICAEQFNVKLRQSPPMFGVMRIGKSVEPIADVREYAHRLLRHVNYRGFASIEFKRDKRDGLPKLIELNVRQPRNGQLLLASGINFPYLIYKDLVQGQMVRVDGYQPTYFIDFLPDLANTVRYDLKKSVDIPKYFAPYLARHKTFAVFALNDPKPFLRLLTSKFGKVTRGRSRLIRYLKPRAAR